MCPAMGREGWGSAGQVATDSALRPQSRFTDVMQENADLKERVEELEHRCIQLSGETDTIGEGAASAGGEGWWTVSPAAELCPPPALPAPRRRLHHPVPESEGSAEGAPPGKGGVHQPAG